MSLENVRKLNNVEGYTILSTAMHACVKRPNWNSDRFDQKWSIWIDSRQN